MIIETSQWINGPAPHRPGHFRDCDAGDHEWGPVLRVGEFYASFDWRAGYDSPEVEIWTKHGDGRLSLFLDTKAWSGWGQDELIELLRRISSVAGQWRANETRHIPETVNR